MKEELYKKIYIKSVNDLPEGKLIHVGSKNGYEELLYIEDGETKKPFRYDDNDTPVIKLSKIDWYLQPIEPVEAENIEETVSKEGLPIYDNEQKYLIHPECKECSHQNSVNCNTCDILNPQFR